MSHFDYIKKKHQMSQDDAMPLLKEHMLNVWSIELVETAFETGEEADERFAATRKILQQVNKETDFEKIMEMYYNYILDGTRDYDLFNDLIYVLVNPEPEESGFDIEAEENRLFPHVKKQMMDYYLDVYKASEKYATDWRIRVEHAKTVYNITEWDALTRFVLETFADGRSDLHEAVMMKALIDARDQ